MARDLTGKNVKADEERAASEQQKSNSARRANTIREVCKRVLSLQEERKAISADINEIMAKEVKGDLEMKISDFKVALRYYALEDPEDRENYLDTIRECFLALGVGEQGDFFSVMEDTEHGAGGEDAPEEVETEDATETEPMAMADRPKAYQAGYSAGEAGKNLDTNKYKEGSKMFALFVDGWQDAQADMVRRLAKDEPAKKAPTHEGTPSRQ